MEKVKTFNKLFSDNNMLNFRDILIDDSTIDENVKNTLKQVDANSMRWLLFLSVMGHKQASELLSNKLTAAFLISQICSNEEEQDEQKN